MANRSKSGLGLGGMISKLSFAKRAVSLGIGVIIFGNQNGQGILQALAGLAGTRFQPKPAKFSARNKWLSSGSLISGKVLIDPGAAKALQSRKSLLAVGIQKVEGEFLKGEVIEICLESHETLALAQAACSSSFLLENTKTPNLEVAHADFIVLL
jgi:glutamate 5-kinase